MADPHHVPEMDAFDVRTVALYRLGLLLAAVGLGGAAAVHIFAPRLAETAHVVTFAGAALSAANLHLYAKEIRWVITSAGWLGATLMLVASAVQGAAAHWLHHAGLGFAFVTLSGFALKEQFCFRIPFLRLLPVLLAASLLPLVLGQHAVAGAILAVACALQVVLAIAKLRMPLHHDIGDKSKYQV